MTHKWRNQILKRKNFAPTFIITVGLWISIILFILYADPHVWGILESFFILVFFALLLTFAILLANTRRGFFIAIGLTVYCFLSLIGVGSFINLFLIALILFLIELYVSYS